MLRFLHGGGYRVAIYALRQRSATSDLAGMRVDRQTGGMTAPRPIPRAALLLGFAGLLPQIAVVLIELLHDPRWLFTAEATGFAYAALIFSFLGGMWWGLAAMREGAPEWVYGAAVLPSLVALACAWPWATGAPWPGPSLIVLGLAIAASPVVDRRLVTLGLAPAWWMGLRVPLSLGLGGLSIIAGLLS
jgi:hypothetical protein